MTWTYDPTSGDDRDTLRLLIGDTDVEVEDDHFFEDEELNIFLALEGDLKLATAQALDSLASSEVMIQKKIRILDLTTDGPSVAAELRARATELRAQFYGGTDDLPQSAELVVDQFTYEQRLRNERLRQGG